MNLLNEIKNIKSGKKELRDFGFLFAAIYVLVSVWLYFADKPFELWFALSILLILVSIFTPKLLLPFHKIWMTLALLLGVISTHLILFVLFYLVITPIRLFVRKDLLDEKIDKNAPTYWQKREKRAWEKEEAERQF